MQEERGIQRDSGEGQQKRREKGKSYYKRSKKNVKRVDNDDDVGVDL